MKIISSLYKFMFRITAASLVVLGILYYLVGTEAGLQLVWSFVETELPKKMHVGSLHGKLISHVMITDLTYRDETVNIAIDKLNLRWDALKLLRNKFVIHDIDADGVTVKLQKSDASAPSQPSSIKSEDLLGWLHKIRIERASVQHALFDLDDAHIAFDGYLDDDWHMQWSVNVPELNHLLSDIHGKLVTTGTIAGSRLQPDIQININLEKFKTEYFGIRSLAGNIHSQFTDHLTDSGSLKVQGLDIESFRVPDFTLKTSSQVKDGIYRLQAAAILSPVNSVNATFTLPKLTSMLTIDQPFQASATVNVKDFSQFNTLFMDVPQVREFTGHVTGSFTGSGTILHPVFDGGLQAQQGSVYIPSASMRLTNITLQTYYHTGHAVNLRGTFVAGQGKASLEGTYDLEKSSLPLNLRVRGDDILAYDTKEYTVKISPDILLSYSDNDLILSGKILVPYAEIHPIDFRSIATLPNEVVVVNNHTVPSTEVPTNVELQVQLVLGQKVNLQYRDLKTKLQGTLNIYGKEGQPLKATGEFSIKDGTYKAYGRTLNIQQGRLIYAGNLLSNPGISLRASQTIKTAGVGGGSQFNASEFKSVYSGSGTLTVGIAVSGVIDKPRITLFSDDSGLSQGDILSYLLFGHPQSSDASGANSLALLGVAQQMYGGPSMSNPTEKLQSKLGLDELSVGTTEYFDATPAAANATPSVKSATTVNVGRNLGHYLSLHYSVGLFQQVQVFSLRYQISKHLAIQTETSTLENGGDLLYQLESAH